MSYEIQRLAFVLFFCLLCITGGGGLLWFALANGITPHPLSLILCSSLVILGCIIASAEVWFTVRD